MNFEDFKRYLDEHTTGIITIGKSGAKVSELDHTQIAKHIRREWIPSDSDWNSYCLEAQFYANYTSEKFPFLPRVYHCCQTDDEIQLIMEKYIRLKEVI